MGICICCRSIHTENVIAGHPFCARCLKSWHGAGGSTGGLEDELRRVFTRPADRGSVIDPPYASPAAQLEAY